MFSDKVKYWMTINEPNCFIGISYKDACHAPFLDDKNALITCTRNVLLAHARAVKVIRERSKITPVVGFEQHKRIQENIEQITQKRQQK